MFNSVAGPILLTASRGPFFNGVAGPIFPNSVAGPIGLGATTITKPYKFTGFGAIAITKPYKFIGFGAIAITKPYKFIGSGAIAPEGLFYRTAPLLRLITTDGVPYVLRWA